MPKLLNKNPDEEAVQKMASNVDVKKHADRIMKLQSDMDDIRADIKSEYDAADNAGIDRKALKLAIKHKGKPVPDDTKMLTNRYLKALGQLPLFAGLGEENNA